ncbi:MAG: response regulator [Chloroflexi bacterium]|nr:response regulator [Chloroflexota bacterium]MBI3733915.1 response regulator [Chloroflexota bacterium]
MRDRVIVIAERDTNIRHLAARTLRRHGYAVVEAATAKAALAAIRQSSPGLLILDLSLPPTGGAV